MEEKIAHLGFIQNVISRMGNNSFLIKGWAFTIVTALVSLDNKTFQVNCWFPFVVTLFFWIFDTYFFKQEKLFRKLYDDVVNEDSSIKLFSMVTNQNNTSYCDETRIFINYMFSRTLFFFYGGIIIISYLFFLKNNPDCVLMEWIHLLVKWIHSLIDCCDT